MQNSTGSTMKLGDRYRGSDFRVFRVIEAWVDEGHEWVRYESSDNKQQYQCYTEAFKARFSRIENYE